MKKITIQEAEKCIMNNEDVFRINDGFIIYISQKGFKNIKSMYDDLFHKNVDFYQINDKNIYTLYIYFLDMYEGNYHKYRDINVSYYETYDNIKNIFMDMINKFLTDNFDINLFDLLSEQDYHIKNDNELKLNTDKLIIEILLKELSCTILTANNYKYILDFKISKLENNIK